MRPHSFSDPPAAFRPSAYWFWHTLPGDEEINAQLCDFRDKGYSTILIQARLAMPRELYLSDAFLQRYRKAIEVMKNLGLVAGLYDDYNWTSGQAGGRTVAGAPHLSERHLFWATSSTSDGKISGIGAPFATGMGPDIAGWIYEGGQPVFGEWELVAAICHDLDGDKVRALTDVTDRVTLRPSDQGCRFEFQGQLAPYQKLTVFLAARCLTSRLINYLLPEAGTRFVEVGLEPYACVLEDMMPETLQFLFFDQPGPQFYTWQEKVGNLGNSLLYSIGLRNAIETALAGSFGQALISLLYDLGPETAGARVRFYETYSHLMNEAFFRPIGDFCRRYGLRMTGHEILPHVGGYPLNGGFSSIDPRVAPAVDFFGIDSFRDGTAVDANNYVPQLSPKLGDSVARANGRSRTMVEIYATATRTERRGAGQWELTPAALRAQSIRMHMAGARQIIMHALYQTCGNDEDNQLFVNPRFDFAPGLNFEPWWDHHRHIADETARLSAFLEDFRPQTPVGVLYTFATALAEGPRHLHGTHFGAWCEALAKISYGHMILDEESIGRAQIRDGQLHVNGLSFSAIVLPGVTRLAMPASITRLAEFAAVGGKIWASGEMPRSLAGEPLDCTSLFAEPPSLQAMADLGSALAHNGPKLKAAGSVHSTMGRDLEDWWKIVLFNEGEADEEVRLTCREGFVFEVWNTEDGTVSDIRPARSITLTLSPHDLICLRLREDLGAHDDVVIDMLLQVSGRAIDLDTGWTFRPIESSVSLPISVTKGWQAQGYASYSGIGCYECTFVLLEPKRVIVDLPGIAVAVNALVDGHFVGRRARSPFRIVIGDLAAGPHRLTLMVSNTAANRFYAGTPYAGKPWPDESGLTAAPRLVLLPTILIEEKN